MIISSVMNFIQLILPIIRTYLFIWLFSMKPIRSSYFTCDKGYNYSVTLCLERMKCFKIPSVLVLEEIRTVFSQKMDWNLSISLCLVICDSKELSEFNLNGFEGQYSSWKPKVDLGFNNWPAPSYPATNQSGTKSSKS